MLRKSGCYSMEGFDNLQYLLYHMGFTISKSNQSKIRISGEESSY